MTIKDRVLRVILLNALGAALFLSAVLTAGIIHVRGHVITGNDHIGSAAAADTEETLMSQVKQQLLDLAEDKAALANENLKSIENYTRVLADIAGRIYTYPGMYPPRVIAEHEEGVAAPGTPFLASAPEFSFASHQDEVYRAANAEDVLRQIATADLGINTSYISSESGFSIAAIAGLRDTRDPNYNRIRHYDFRTRPWYTGAKEKGDIFWTDAIISPEADRISVVVCAAPFYSVSGGVKVFRGVAGSGISLFENVDSILNSVQVGKTGYAFLLSRKGQLIFSSKSVPETGTAANAAANVAANAGANTSTDLDVGADFLRHRKKEVRDLAERMTRGERGIAALELDGKAVYAAYAPLPSIGWSIAVVVPITEVIAPAHRIQQNVLSHTETETEKINRNIILIFIIILAVIVFAIGLTIFCGRGLANSIAAPIMALNAAAKRISAGNSENIPAIKTGDEIEALAVSFNLMVRSIKTISSDRERIGTELGVAMKIQTDMLPRNFSGRDDVDIYAEMQPARKVGGDFYDFFFVDERKDRLAIMIADIGGRGLPAALFMVTTKTLVKNQVKMKKPLEEALYAVNNQLCENNEECHFVTFFLCALDLYTGELEFVNGGHNFPLIARTGGMYRFLELKKGIPLGVNPDTRYESGRLKLEEGDRLYLYTNGIIEAENPAGEQFGREQLLAAANKFRDFAPRQFDGAIRRALANFMNGAERVDDLTTLAFLYKQKKFLRR